MHFNNNFVDGNLHLSVEKLQLPSFPRHS